MRKRAEAGVAVSRRAANVTSFQYAGVTSRVTTARITRRPTSTGTPRAVRFAQACAANPLCSPTRTSILTGFYPAHVGSTAPVCHVPEIHPEKSLARGNPNQRAIFAETSRA